MDWNGTKELLLHHPWFRNLSRDSHALQSFIELWLVPKLFRDYFPQCGPHAFDVLSI